MCTKRLPSFFIDDSNSDKYEEVSDFYIAWTLRCAASEYSGADKNVHNYSKKLLAKLIKDDPEYLNEKNILSVKTWKQWDSVDIWIEAEIDGDDKIYAIIIEDKYCSKLTEDQLQNYKSIPRYDLNKVDLKYFVIRLEQNSKYDQTDEETCKACGYTLLRWNDLTDAMMLKNGRTNNSLFDEFWFRWEDDSKNDNDKEENI